jgi:hypothetical protein
MSVAACEAGYRQTDLAGRRIGWLVWGVPAVFIALGIGWDAARAWLWVPSLVFAGTACIANASRCGRLHCFITGPVYLLAAITALLDGTHLVRVAWPWILALVVGGTLVGYGLEWVRGRYIRALPANEGGR